MQINIAYNNQTKNKIDYESISTKFHTFIKKRIKPSFDNIEVGIHFISPRDIQTLNIKFRNIDKPTDVLSFPVYDNLQKSKCIIDHEINLGDIFICVDIAKNQAKKNNISTNKEIETLAIHGLKHLIGIHHA